MSRVLIDAAGCLRCPACGHNAMRRRRKPSTSVAVGTAGLMIGFGILGAAGVAALPKHFQCSACHAWLDGPPLKAADVSQDVIVLRTAAASQKAASAASLQAVLPRLSAEEAEAAEEALLAGRPYEIAVHKKQVAKGVIRHLQEAGYGAECRNVVPLEAVLTRTAAQSPALPDVVSRLRQLADLRGQGLLTEEEFTAAKAQLLAR